MANVKSDRFPLFPALLIISFSFLLLCQIQSTKAGRACKCKSSSRRCQLMCGTVASDSGLYVFPFKRSDALLSRLVGPVDDETFGEPLLENEPLNALINEDDDDAFLRHYAWLLADAYNKRR